MSRARLLTVLATGLVIMTSLSAAEADEFTTFQRMSEGCSGGGERCGSFPLIPAGDAEYEHAARADGSFEVTALAERGLPPLCASSLCAPDVASYHAEAAAAVWVDVDMPATSSFGVTIGFTLEELETLTEQTLGSASSALTGVISVREAPGAPAAACSDGTPVLGRLSASFDASTPTGPGEHQTTLTCAGEGALLSATRWRIGLQARATASARGGTAEAEGRGSLDRVLIG